MTTYADVYNAWQDDPEGFWLKAAEEIDWIKAPSKGLDDSDAPFYRWFRDAICNTCWNAVDRHVENGRADQNAIIYDSPVTATKRMITYDELKGLVPNLAGALAARCAIKGDCVIIYMPMIPEAVISMLACSGIAAVHSVAHGRLNARQLVIENQRRRVLNDRRRLASFET
jgi:propionyl-CoA synthetase